MRKVLFIILLLALVMALPVHAATDPPPAVYITAPKQVDTTASITVFAEDYGYKSGIVYVELLEDGKGIGARNYCTGLLPNTCQAAFTVTHNTKGNHNYAAVAVDRSSNKKMALAGISFLGFDQAPVLNFEENPHVDENQNINLIINSYDKNKYTVTVSTSKLPKGAVFDGSYFRWTPDFSQSGTYSVTFTAKNTKNLSSSKTMHITVNDVNRPPQIISATPSTTDVRIYEGDQITFKLNTTDPDSTSSIQWILDNKQVSSAKSYVYKPDYNAAGPHILVGRAYDKDYSTRYLWNINVVDVNRPPVMQQIAAKTVKVGQTLHFALSATDPDKDPLNYSVNYLPANARFDPDTRIFDWAPAYSQAGVYDIVFSVADTHNQRSSTTVTITVTREDVTPDYGKLYDSYGKLKTEAPPVSNNNYPITQNQTTGKTCTPGYLCSSITYFIQ